MSVGRDDQFQRNQLEARYETVRFPVADFSIDGGHDKVAHRAYRRRGADVETTGQQPYSGQLTVPLYNATELGIRYGTLYPDLYRTLILTFEDTPRGILIHPTKGELQVHIDQWSEQWAPDKRNGLTLVVRWTEHATDASVISVVASAPTTARAGELVRRAGAVDTALAAIEPSISSSVSSILAIYSATTFDGLFTTQLAFLDAAIRTYAELSYAFRAMTEPVRRVLELDTFGFSAQHAARVALEELRAGAYALRSAYVPNQFDSATYAVPTDMPLWRVANLVYGDPSRASLLRRANFVADPSLVRRGTVLNIPPLEME